MAIETLSPWEARAYAAIERAANEGARFPTCDDLVAELGCECVATTVNVVRRLEQKGLIEVERYQRERVGRIVATGKKTRDAKTKVAPWRHSPEQGSQIVHLLRRAHPEAYQEMLVQARRERMSLNAYLAEFLAEAWACRLIQSEWAEG